jgi:flavorubredoxin
MAVSEIKKDIYSVGAQDWDRRLFDELIPLPDGTSYNSYIIMGKDKTALLDTVDPTKEGALIDNLKELKLEKIDYLVCHHAEQDHSGSIPKILELYPEARVVTNPKCKKMLIEHLLIDADKIIEVADREKLDLGGKILEFIYAPWVHWPETMFTYLKEEKILFTCDFLGSHMATSDLYVKDQAAVYPAAKRYYAEIMMPFRTFIKKHLKVIEQLAIDIIAPSHGPLHDKPEFIIEAYKEWVSDKVKPEVVIPYVSMHGSTAAMVNHLINRLTEKEISVKPFNLAKADIGELAMELVDAATVVIGSPTVLVRPHPAAVYAAFLLNALRPKTKYVGIVGSFGWGGKMAEGLKDLVSAMKVEFLDPVIIKGYPRKEDFAALDKLADLIEIKHNNIKEGGEDE